MKRLFLIVLTIMAIATSSSAQEIYYEIRSKAQEDLLNPATPPLIKQFSNFKVEALNYMAIKMKEEMPDSSATLLDKEALALNTFLTIYTNALVKNSQMPPAHQVKVIGAFMDASYGNPLFNDPDKDLVLVFFKNGDSMTRFSLDTDWRRAVLAVQQAMKQLE
jgi:hypothetical protein